MQGCHAVKAGWQWLERSGRLVCIHSCCQRCPQRAVRPGLLVCLGFTEIAQTKSAAARKMSVADMQEQEEFSKVSEGRRHAEKALPTSIKEKETRRHIGATAEPTRTRFWLMQSTAAVGKTIPVYYKYRHHGLNQLPSSSKASKDSKGYTHMHKERRRTADRESKQSN
eukprot:1159184-Pelagomonas_calceolata.AAC.4